MFYKHFIVWFLSLGSSLLHKPIGLSFSLLVFVLSVCHKSLYVQHFNTPTFQIRSWKNLTNIFEFGKFHPCQQEEKLHMHKMEYSYTCTWNSSNILTVFFFRKGEEDIPIGIPMTDTVFVVKDRESQIVTKGNGLLYIGRLLYTVIVCKSSYYHNTDFNLKTQFLKIFVFD